MNTTRIPKQRCWNCGYEMDATSEAYGDRPPRPGDITLCISCGAAAVFDKELVGRKPAPDEQTQIERDPRITYAQIVRADMVGDTLKKKK